jgi:hypothetical protein
VKRRGKYRAYLKARMTETINGKTAIGENAQRFIIVFSFISQGETDWKT